MNTIFMSFARSCQIQIVYWLEVQLTRAKHVFIYTFSHFTTFWLVEVFFWDRQEK